GPSAARSIWRVYAAAAPTAPAPRRNGFLPIVDIQEPRRAHGLGRARGAPPRPAAARLSPPHRLPEPYLSRWRTRTRSKQTETVCAQAPPRGMRCPEPRRPFDWPDSGSPWIATRVKLAASTSATGYTQSKLNA